MPDAAPAVRLRADAERNERAILEAAAALFAASGGSATVRDVSEAAGVGMGTLYRRFPTRSDLVVAVYRHQIEACAEAGPTLLRSSPSPDAAIAGWVDRFVDFLGTKHGLIAVLRGDPAGLSALHRLFVDRLVPVLDALLDAGRAAGEVHADVSAYQLLRAIGDLCAWQPDDPDYDLRRSIALLTAGLREPLPER